MFVQNFLRNGGTLQDLEAKYSISSNCHSEHPNLVLLKYDQIDSPFSDEIVRDCRGIILDLRDNFRIVNFGMRKFFNHGEKYAADINWTTARCLEKCDGSLMQLYAYDGQWHVATSGNPEAAGRMSDHDFTFKEMFWKVFNACGKLPPVDCGKCFFLELMTPYNKIVVPHETCELVLLGGRDLTTMRELTLEKAASYLGDVPVVKSFNLKCLQECINTFETFSGRDQEGYVIVDKNFNRIKIKHPKYVQIHQLRNGLGSLKSLVGVVRNGEVEEVIACLPEYKPDLTEAKTRFDALVSDLEAAYATIEDIPNQKDFAHEACKTKCSSALFALRAKKTTSIRAFLKAINIELIIQLLGYKM